MNAAASCTKQKICLCHEYGPQILRSLLLHLEHCFSKHTHTHTHTGIMRRAFKHADVLLSPTPGCMRPRLRGSG